MSKLVTPGSILGKLGEVESGPGTYTRDGEVHASLTGDTSIRNEDNVVSVGMAGRRSAAVPVVGSAVTGRVLRVNARMATVEFLVLEGVPVHSTFRGIVRVQDVRATEVDKVEIYKSFRPGDVISAEVISMGDKQFYYLSTAKNHLGVIFAKCSVSGEPMIPISWEKMQCPKTETREFRKVAKVSAPTSS